MEDENNKVHSDELKEYKVIRETENSGEKKAPAAGKKIFKVAGCILAGVIVLLFAAVIFRDILIENSIRHIGSLVTGTEVKIDSFKTSFAGTVELKNIKVGNPAGYKKPYAFEVDRVYVKLLPKTLTSKEPVVETFEVTGVRIDMEMKGAGRSNLTDIQKNVEKFAGGSASARKKDAPQQKADPNAPAPLIRKIALTSMEISFSSATLNSSVPVPLAPIYLQNVGGKGKPLGQTLWEITGTVMGSINTVGGTVISGVEAVGNAGKTIGSGVTNLFKKKK